MRAEYDMEGWGFNLVEVRPEFTVIQIIGKTAAEAALERLTDTERLELEYVSRGYSSYESAEARGVSFRTNKNHRASIRHKLDVHNMAHAVRIGCENDFFDGRLQAPTDDLTPALIEELESASLGLTAREAAPISLRGARTIKNYRSMAISVLGARNMPHAVRLAFDNDILPLA